MLSGFELYPRWVPLIQLVLFLVMLDFPFPTFKLFTIVSSFLSWTYI